MKRYQTEAGAGVSWPNFVRLRRLEAVRGLGGLRGLETTSKRPPRCTRAAGALESEPRRSGGALKPGL